MTKVNIKGYQMLSDQHGAPADVWKKHRESGSVLIYIIIVMLIFGFLGAGMVSMFTSSTMMSSGVPNYARTSQYLAEAGMRYAISELRNSGYNTSTIESLNGVANDKIFTLGNDGSFTINVFGKWFKAGSDYDQSSGTISLTVPEGKVPRGFAIPANAYLVNLESFRDSVLFGGSPNSIYSAQITTAPTLNTGDTSFSLELGDNFQAVVSQGHKLLIAVKPAATVTIGPNDDELTVADEAWNFFPPANGSIYIANAVTGIINEYYYEDMVQGSTKLNLVNLPAAIEFKNTDFVMLSNHNHLISTAGTSDGVNSSVNLKLAMDFGQNIESPQVIAPPAKELSADVEPSSTSDYSTPAESTGGAVEVSVDAEGNPLITLGGNVTGGSFGSVWYGGTSSQGGVNVCNAGVCEFNDGMRAFFIMDYQGTGDGFTFAIINGDKNTTDSTGGKLVGGVAVDGELLGYAGDGIDGKGLQPPKMALEFDTYLNPDAYDPSTGSGRNDQGSSDLDHLQFVFWGDTADDKFDDNVHGFDGMREKWSYSTSGNIRSSPALDSLDSRIYFGSDDHYIYSLDSDGSLNWRYNTGDNVQSSPLISGSYIHIGSNNYRFYLLNRNQTSISGWFFNFGGDVRSSPAAGAGNHVYVGSNNNSLWDVSNSTLASTLKVTGDDVLSSPAIDPNDGAIYFGSNDNKIYAINPDGSTKSGSWPVTTGGDVVTRPAIDTTGGSYDGTIYVGSKDGYIYALNPDGSQAWTYDTTGPIESSPVIHKAISSESDSNDGTVYIGTDALSNEGYLLALDPNPSPASRVKWSFQTGINNVRSPPTFDDGDWDDDGVADGDKTIWFGADNSYLYALSPSGVELGNINLGGRVRPKPTLGPDGMVYAGSDADKVYAITPHCSIENIEDILTEGNAITPSNLATLGDPIDVSGNNWLDEGRYWAVRMEMVRGTTANTRGKYEYTLKAWIRQCSDSTCATDWTTGKNIVGTYFTDTRIKYSAKSPHLEQTVELCSADHDKFETALIGFTEATGSATQNVIIQKLAIGLIRPGDYEITSDPNW